MSELQKTVSCGIDDAEPTAWQKVWREGLCPQLTTAGLQNLQRALERDDPRLITGTTVKPPPLMCRLGEAVESCCPLCWAILDTNTQPCYVSVGQLEERFADTLLKASDRLGWPLAAKYWLNWVDESPRDEMRRLLLAEVHRELGRRAAIATAAA
jgi:hypothetical protein